MLPFLRNSHTRSNIASTLALLVCGCGSLRLWCPMVHAVSVAVWRSVWLWLWLWLPAQCLQLCGCVALGVAVSVSVCLSVPVLSQGTPPAARELCYIFKVNCVHLRSTVIGCAIYLKFTIFKLGGVCVRAARVCFFSLFFFGGNPARLKIAGLEDGQYLVRTSDSKDKKTYELSVVTDKAIARHSIHKINGKFSVEHAAQTSS